MEDLINTALNFLQGGLFWGVILLVVVVVLFGAFRFLTGGGRTPKGKPQDLTINVMQLGTQGPPGGSPSLEFYNVPVRLAAIVVAPAGRVRELPPLNQLDDLFDAVVPGLARVVAAHRPLVRKWPPQPSARGFAHMFFGHAKLPGQGGKGTPWSSAAGLFKVEGQAMMAGMVLRTDEPSSHSQEIVESEEQWLRLLKVMG